MLLLTRVIKILFSESLDIVSIQKICFKCLPSPRQYASISCLTVKVTDKFACLIKCTL